MGINTCIHYGEYACLSSIDPQFSISKLMYITPQIAKFMWPTLDPPGSCRPRWAPCLFPWALLSGTDLSGSGIDSPLIFSCAGRIKCNYSPMPYQWRFSNTIVDVGHGRVVLFKGASSHRERGISYTYTFDIWHVESSIYKPMPCLWVHGTKAYLAEIKDIREVLLHREITKDTHRTRIKYDLNLADYKT